MEFGPRLPLEPVERFLLPPSVVLPRFRYVHLLLSRPPVEPISDILQKKPAPEWCAPAVVNSAFADISSKDFKGKWLVLFFYPLDFTFVCPTEIIAFSERIAEFKALGCEVVGASVGNPLSSIGMKETANF